jgi:hypothetical protein
VLLINPPISKPSEPPAGIAKLSGALSANNIKHHVLDASVEGIYYLLGHAPASPDTWTRRAAKSLSRNLSALRDPDLYRNFDRYKRAVADINRVLEKSVDEKEVRISVVDYQHRDLSPVKSSDLVYAAEHPEENPFYPYFASRLTGLIGREIICVAGFSLNYLSQALTTFAMIGFLKREYPSITIVAGGGLITSWMRNPRWKNLFGGLVDNCIAGPGEIPLIEILGKKASKRVHCRPAYDKFPTDQYLSPGLILPYSTSNGCYWNSCSFCPEKVEGSTYTQIRSDSVMDDLMHLKSRLKPTMIHFTDNALSPRVMNKIAQAPLNSSWYGFVRMTRHLTDPGFCKALRDSGCVMLKLGLESGNQGVLDYMNKGCDLELAASVLKALHSAGIATYVYLLFGTPSETVKEARDTLDFVVKHSKQIDFLNVAIFNLPVNSIEAKEVDVVDFYEGDLSLYSDFRHPLGWGRRQVRQFLEKEFRKHPAIKSIVRNHPPFFTSNHAPFFQNKERRIIDLQG